MTALDQTEVDRLMARLQVAPDDYEANRDLGLLLTSYRKWELEGERYLLKALGSGRVEEQTCLILDRLGSILTLRGQFEKAADVYRMAYQVFPHVVDFKVSLGNTLLRLARHREASAILRDSIDELYGRAREEAARAGGPLVHLLGPHRVICRFIGEAAAKIDLYLKAVDLGLVDRADAILLAPPEDVRNRAFLEYWNRYIEVVFDLPDIERTIAAHRSSLVYLDYYTLPDGRTLHRDLAHRAVQKMWEAEGRGPLLTLSEVHRERGRAFLESRGVPRDAWLVCLHVREAGFHKEEIPWSRNHFRNADVTTYLPAIEEITRRGGWVLRIGDRSMTPLPDLPGVVDLALDEDKQDWMDVFAIAEARFFFGMASGPSSIAINFGTPTLGTNWFPLGAWPYCDGDLFLHKTLRSIETGRELSLAESLDGPLFLAMEPLFLAAKGLEPVDNTAEEIAEAVVEMIERLDGTVRYSDEDEARQAAWQAAGDPCGVGQAPPVARGFLRRHPDLIATGR